MYKLADGRTISLNHLSIHSTYAGLMEGSIEDGARIILRNLGDGSHQKNEPKALITIIPKSLPLPGYTWVAMLSSRSPARTDNSDYMSKMWVQWYTERLDQSVDAEINAVLPLIDWNAYAEDYDFVLGW